MNQATVVLLHGLFRTRYAMNGLKRTLENHGFNTINVSYPSRSAKVEILTQDYVMPEIIEQNHEHGLHFVTHSMGGIIVRQIAKLEPQIPIGRVVMLAPPNHGSELVDRLGRLAVFERINGPAARELATSLNSLPNQLGPATFELGVIAGTKSINPFFSALIPGENDGKVSVASTKLKGMKDFIKLPTNHTMIVRNHCVRCQVSHFLKHGEFDKGCAQIV